MPKICEGGLECDSPALGIPTAQALAALLDEPAYSSRTDLIVVSFSDQLLQAFNSADAPPCVALAPGIAGGRRATRPPAFPPVPDVAAFQVPPSQNGLAVPEMLLSAAEGQDAHGDGYAVHVWPNGDEPDGEASYARLIALGIDGYMSSQPGRLHAFLCAQRDPRPDGPDRCPIRHRPPARHRPTARWPARVPKGDGSCSQEVRARQEADSDAPKRRG